MADPTPSNASTLPTASAGEFLATFAIVLATIVGFLVGIARLSRHFQTGYLYWYALVMILGVFGLMTWQLWPDLTSLLARLGAR